jgi:hypothetical protein
MTMLIGGRATAAGLESPWGLAYDLAGNLYISDQNQQVVRKVSPAGIITAFAGTVGTFGFTGDNGPATSAQLHNPAGLAVDAGGDVFIADSGNARIRKVTPAGVTSTVVGTGTTGSAGDGGPATAA